MIRDNKAHHGPLPAFWATRGERYGKQAYCADPEAVTDIYERVATASRSPSRRARYDLYPASVKNVVRFAANHTGVIECSYTHEGQTETWAHEVTPVVESALWWRANRVLDANRIDPTQGQQGRPARGTAGQLD